jgi:hypothetical protein
MFTVREERDIDAPIEAVFDWLTTSNNYATAPRMFSGRLIRAGREGGESLGAIRTFRSSIIWWWREEIIAYERPRTFGYQVLRSIPPVYQHHGATIDLTDSGGLTHVTWVTTSSMPVPVIGPALERSALPVGRMYVRSILDAAISDLSR